MIKNENIKSKTTIEVKKVHEKKMNNNHTNGIQILNCICFYWICIHAFLLILGVPTTIMYLINDMNIYISIYKEFDESEAKIQQKYEPEEVTFIHLMVLIEKGLYKKKQEECQFVVYPLYDIYKDQVNLIFEELSHHSFWKLVKNLCFNTYKLKIIQNSMIEEANRIELNVDIIEYDSNRAEQFCKYLYNKEDQTKSRDDIIELNLKIKYHIFDDSFTNALLKFYSIILLFLIIGIPIKWLINKKKKIYQQLQEEN